MAAASGSGSGSGSGSSSGSGGSANPNTKHVRESEWDDLTADDKDDSAEPAACIFCTTTCPDAAATFQHMTDKHGFDLHQTKKQRAWSFYDTIRAVNFLRSKAAGANATPLNKHSIDALLSTLLVASVHCICSI